MPQSKSSSFSTIIPGCYGNFLLQNFSWDCEEVFNDYFLKPTLMAARLSMGAAYNLYYQKQGYLVIDCD